MKIFFSVMFVIAIAIVWAIVSLVTLKPYTVSLLGQCNLWAIVWLVTIAWTATLVGYILYITEKR